MKNWKKVTALAIALNIPPLYSYARAGQQIPLVQHDTERELVETIEKIILGKIKERKYETIMRLIKGKESITAYMPHKDNYASTQSPAMLEMLTRKAFMELYHTAPENERTLYKSIRDGSYNLK